MLNTADQSQPLTVGQANALLNAIINHGAPPTRTTARPITTTQPAANSGAAESCTPTTRPDHLEASPEVLYSLRYRDQPTGF